jgi:hypothetical protein
MAAPKEKVLLADLHREDRDAMVLAAIGMTGPLDPKGSAYPEWNARLRQNFIRVRMLMEDDSELVDDLETLDRCRTFEAVVVKVEREESTTRGLVTLKSAPSKFHKDGLETVRTDRTDNPSGKRMAYEMFNLIDHRVRVWVETVSYETKQGEKRETRVLKFFKDLG